MDGLKSGSRFFVYCLPIREYRTWMNMTNGYNIVYYYKWYLAL